MNEVANDTARASERWGAWIGSWVLWSLRRVAALAGALGGAAAVLLYVYQERLLYYPQLPGVPKRPDQNPQGCRDPGEEGVEEWRDVWIQTADGVKLHSWLLLHPRGGQPRHRRPTILYFHGNAGECVLPRKIDTVIAACCCCAIANLYTCACLLRVPR